jgi:hypothetical protein
MPLGSLRLKNQRGRRYRSHDEYSEIWSSSDIPSVMSHDVTSSIIESLLEYKQSSIPNNYPSILSNITQSSFSQYLHNISISKTRKVRHVAKPSSRGKLTSRISNDIFRRKHARSFKAALNNNAEASFLYTDTPRFTPTYMANCNKCNIKLSQSPR